MFNMHFIMKYSWFIRRLYSPAIILMSFFLISLLRPVSTPTFTGILGLSMVLAAGARLIEWRYERN
jgi:hypothetical protein